MSEGRQAQEDSAVLVAGDAGRRVRRRHRPGRAIVDLTPLVDVSLTLLVFMLLNNQRGDIQQLPVSLPATASSGAQWKRERLLEVIIDRHGAISSGGVALALEELADLVGSDSRISILADRDCRHGRVVQVVDRLRGAGAQAIYYASEELDDAW